MVIVYFYVCSVQCYFDNERSCYCCGTIEKLREVNTRDDARASNMHNIIEAQMSGATAPAPATSVISHGRNKQEPIAVATERLPEAVVVYE